MNVSISTLVIGCIVFLLGGCDTMPSASDAPATYLERYQRAKKEIEKAKDEEDRWLALGDVAKASAWIGRFEEARDYAQELKALTPNYESSWNYGNAIQDYNITLGLIALSSGDVEASKKFLLAAGRTPGSPQLNSFGPNMSLAKVLLIAEEKETVLQYFELCRDFWPREKLSTWEKEVKAGIIPDFGANLVY